MVRPDVRRLLARATAAIVLGTGVGLGGATASASPIGMVPGGLDVGGLQRTYLLHVPTANPAGLVINLHGAGMTGGDQARATNYDAVGGQHGFAVVHPDGVDFSWADGRGASIPDRQGVDDVGFLVALAEKITRDYGIDPGRVFATGMSAGGFMATRLGCERADVFSAIAPVGGTLGTGIPCAPSRPVSVLEVHGTADPVVPFTGGTMVGRGGVSDVVAARGLAERWRTVDRCPADLVPDNTDVNGPGVQRVTAFGCADGTEVSFVQIDGGGHVWPTGYPFDAAQASALFFATHGR